MCDWASSHWSPSRIREAVFNLCVVMYKPRPAAYVALLLYPALFRALPWLLENFAGMDISTLDGAFLFGLTPIFALGIFSAAHFQNKTSAWVLPMVSWLLGDLLIRAVQNNWGFFYPGWYWTYLGFGLTCACGFLLRRGYRMPAALATSLAGSLVFFVVSNFGAWSYYPRTLAGLVECYTMALPFLKWQLPSTLLFTGVLFSSVGRRHLLVTEEVASSPMPEESSAFA